jgi:hypothetical protein
MLLCGQGKDNLSIPPAYGHLAIQIPAAFNNFLITKHLDRSPPSATTRTLTTRRGR